MALPRCDYDGHFWPKKKHLFYVGWGQNEQKVHYRLRFCATHADLVDQDLSEFEVPTVLDTTGAAYAAFANCLSCRQPVNGTSWQVFVTGYPAQDERKDYWGQLHVDHQLPEYLRDRWSAPETTSI